MALFAVGAGVGAPGGAEGIRRPSRESVGEASNGRANETPDAQEIETLENAPRAHRVALGAATSRLRTLRG